MSDTHTRLNLDKICAEYGMGLLNIFKRILPEINKILQQATNREDFISKDSTSELSDEEKDFFNYKSIFWDSKKREVKFEVDKFETEITKALGILVEDGPFAYIIWLKSQDKESHRAMLIQTARLLLELNIIESIEPKENLKDKIEEIFLTNISNDLTKLFLVKTVLEKMLIYARYKAKAMEKEGE